MMRCAVGFLARRIIFFDHRLTSETAKQNGFNPSLGDEMLKIN